MVHEDFVTQVLKKDKDGMQHRKVNCNGLIAAEKNESLGRKHL